MDFDPKCFFDNPPRMKEDLKDYVKNLSKTIVLKILNYAELLFPGEKLNEKHIKLIVLAICPDPITTYNRQGLCIQNVKLKPIHRVLCKSIDSAMKSITDDKYGNVDKKICKACAKEMKIVKASQSAVVAVATVISQVLGIILQSAYENYANAKTLTLDLVKSSGVHHKGSNGQSYAYGSIMRFVNIIELFHPQNIREKGKTESASKKQKVSFNDAHKSGRPSTPDNCFWED